MYMYVCMYIHTYTVSNRVQVRSVPSAPDDFVVHMQTVSACLSVSVSVSVYHTHMHTGACVCMCMYCMWILRMFHTRTRTHMHTGSFAMAKKN